MELENIDMELGKKVSFYDTKGGMINLEVWSYVRDNVRSKVWILISDKISGQMGTIITISMRLWK